MFCRYRFMNFAVTGGAGFIGSHLVKHLVSCGYGVTVIDNLHSGSLSNLAGVLDKINFVKLDILEYEKLKDVLIDIDGIFHQAALVSVQESFKKKDEYKRVNIDGTENIFKIAQEIQVKVVYASSSSIYGDAEKIPISEDSKRNPINPYGQTKLEDELLAEKYHSKGVRTIGLRYFNVFGAGQTLEYAGAITKFLDRIKQGTPPIIFGDGSQVRDFVFVDDVAKANLAAMTNNIEYGIFNVGTGRPTSIRDLAYLMIKASGKSLEPIYDDLPPGDAKISVADISSAAAKLRWKSSTSLEDGLCTILNYT